MFIICLSLFHQILSGNMYIPCEVGQEETCKALQGLYASYFRWMRLNQPYKDFKLSLDATQSASLAIAEKSEACYKGGRL